MVRQGQKGFTIVAPVMGGEGNAKLVTSKPAWVFDVTQTDERTQRLAAFPVLQDAPEGIGTRSGTIADAAQDWDERRPGTFPAVALLDARDAYGAGVASPVMASGGSTRMASRTARTWPSLRISPATLAGM